MPRMLLEHNVFCRKDFKIIYLVFTIYSYHKLIKSEHIRNEKKIKTFNILNLLPNHAIDEKSLRRLNMQKKKFAWNSKPSHCSYASGKIKHFHTLSTSSNICKSKTPQQLYKIIFEPSSMLRVLLDLRLWVTRVVWLIWIYRRRNNALDEI